MAYLSVRYIEVPKSLGTDRLYYGFSSTTDIPLTCLAVFQDLKPLMLEYYGEDEEQRIDEVIEWSVSRPSICKP